MPWNAILAVTGLVMIKFRSQRTVLYRNAKEIVISPSQIVGILRFLLYLC